jgi:hypothetical protein
VLSARVDPALVVRVLGSRELRYSDDVRGSDDRPAHVRAASGLAFAQGRLAVIQDDAAFIAMVAGEDVAAIMLPRGAGGRRRFEVALGNKHDKLDLECCVALGDDLYAFGSGSLPVRERIVQVGYGTHTYDASPLYRRLREELGGPVNIEGIAHVVAHGRDELWLFHRGNTGPDDAGPAAVRIDRAALVTWLAGDAPVPEPVGSARFDLGAAGGGIQYGFTDAVATGDRVLFLAAAEGAANAIDDGPALGSLLGTLVVGSDGLPGDVRVTSLGRLKAEGLALDPARPGRAWVVTDPDDVEQPARLYEVDLAGI